MGEKKKLSDKFEVEELASLSSDLADAEVKNFGARDLKSYESLLKNIRNGFKQASNAYITIGCALWQIHHDEYYRIVNFKNIAQLAESMFEIKKATCHNYIKVIERFGLFSSTGKAIGVRDEFKDFSCSQLVAMLSFTPEQIEQVQPGWKVKTITEFGRGSLIADRSEESREASGSLPSSDDLESVHDSVSTSEKSATEYIQEELDFMPVPELEPDRILLATCNDFDEILKNQAKYINAMDELKNDQNFKNKKIRFVLELAFE